MAVVIDEMQVEPAAPKAEGKTRGGGGEGDGGGDADKPPAPEEIARALSQQHERYERVRAY
jgi:hypothetical protein